MDKANTFIALGNSFKYFAIANPSVTHYANIKNPWFTDKFIALAAKNWAAVLTPEKVHDWLKNYPNSNKENNNKTLGIIAAGNIPWVALHDILCGIAAGFIVKCKLSSNDDVLMKWAIETLIKINPALQEKLIIVENRLEKVDCLIATGTDNAARYFEYYFKDIPKIIRKNRNSVAVLDAAISADDLKLLADDVFTYFGLGCRNVSRVFFPKGFDITTLIDAFEHYNYVGNHHKFANNYTYHKAILLMNLDKHLDNGFMLFREHPASDIGIKAPLSQLYYSFYEDKNNLLKDLKNSDTIQCIVCNDKGYTPIGGSQVPSLNDYADGVDTLEFLLQH